MCDTIADYDDGSHEICDGCGELLKDCICDDIYRDEYREDDD